MTETATPPSAQTLRAIEGEDQARAYLARLQAEQVSPDELAELVATLYGAALFGFARVVEKAIGGTR